jgi:hypothetical protein
VLSDCVDSRVGGHRKLGLVTTLAFILFVTIVFPLLVMLAVTWLISAAYDETSALRRGCGRLEEAWLTRRALA